MNDEDESSSRNGASTNDELESQAIALAVKLASEFKPWAEQDRAVYTSEVMERELDKLFPVDTFLERKRCIRENNLVQAENKDQ